MTDNIRLIFQKNIELLRLSDRIALFLRRQNFDAGLSLTIAAINHFTALVEPLKTEGLFFNQDHKVIDNHYINGILTSLADALKVRDYILLADLFEDRMTPFLLKLQDIIMAKEGFSLDEETYRSNLEVLKERYPDLGSDLYALPDPRELLGHGYFIEFTSCGLMTLALENIGKKYYLHSNNIVQNESYALASSWFHEDKTDYIIYGLGLGYHIEALNEVNSYVNIEVYESDIHIIQLACAFANMGKIISNPNNQLIYDPDFLSLPKRIGNLSTKSEFFLHYPSLHNIKNDKIREMMENYFVQYSSVMNQQNQLNGNFGINIYNYDGLVDELADVFRGKDLYIIAAGPSLDKNFLQLKELNNDTIILATGTTFKKLLNSGIRPDYVIVTDGNPRVYSQIKDIETSDVPMLFLSTAYKGFSQNYQGRKYIILQKDFDRAEKYAEEKGCHLYKTGGSVSTTALDIGITFGCRRIIFLGLDLAYTDHFVHAEDTSRRNMTTDEGLKQVEDINGKLIFTSKSLDMYRKWIENRIKEEKNIEFIDATEGGAKIAGMRTAKLADVIKEENLDKYKPDIYNRHE